MSASDRSDRSSSGRDSPDLRSSGRDSPDLESNGCDSPIQTSSGRSSPVKFGGSNCCHQQMIPDIPIEAASSLEDAQEQVKMVDTDATIQERYTRSGIDKNI